MTNLFLKPEHGAPMRAVDEVEASSGFGLAGDAAYGRTDRQVLLIEGETLEAFELVPGSVRENVTTRGVRLVGLPPGTRLRVGATVLVVTSDCSPCDRLDRVRPGLRQALTGRRGLLARVETGGALRVGDPVALEPPASERAETS